jgi:hypothetical protein
MPIASVVSLLRSYSTLAYAPPMALLKLLQGLAEPQLGELQPEELTGLLQCYSLFKACGPELWNRVVGILTGSAVESLSQAALLQLYQVGCSGNGKREWCQEGRGGGWVGGLQLYQVGVGVGVGVGDGPERTGPVLAAHPPL